MDLYRGNIGIMEKKMGTIGIIERLYRDNGKYAPTFIPPFEPPEYGFRGFRVEAFRV